MANQSLSIERLTKAIAPRYRHVSPIDEIKWATEKVHVLAVIRASKQLKNATQDSVESAVLQGASMGLSFNPTLHHCYMIPRRMRKRKQGESDAEYAKVPTFAYASPSYRGLAHLAVHSGAVRFLRADVVFHDDVFEYYGAYEKPKYIGNSIDTGNRKEKHAKGAVAVAKTKDGDFLCEFIDSETMQRIRKMSEMPDGAIWNPNKMWTEGWKKAAIRRLYKTLPDSSPAINTAIQIMNDNEGIAEKEITGAVVVLSDEQAMTLHSKFANHGIEGVRAETWLSRLAKKYGVGSYTEIPADQYDDACKAIDDALKNIQVE